MCRRCRRKGFFCVSVKTRRGRPGKSEVQRRKLRLQTYEPESGAGIRCLTSKIDDFAKLAIEKHEAPGHHPKTNLFHEVTRSCILSNMWINTRTKDYSGTSLTTAAAQRLKMDFQEFAEASANVIAQLNPQRSPKISDEKIILQIRKIQLQQEKSKFPSVVCLSYYGMVAHLTNSKMKMYFKNRFLAPSEEGYVPPTSFESANVFRSFVDGPRDVRIRIGLEMIDKILTTAVRSNEQYFEDGPDDVQSLKSEFEIKDVPICNWETNEKFKASLHYRRTSMIDGEIFVSMTEMKDLAPRVASWTRRVSKRSMSDTLLSTPEQAKRVRCVQRGEIKTDVAGTEEFKDGDGSNGGEASYDEFNSCDTAVFDLMDSKNGGLEAADDVEYDVILQKLFE